MKIIDMISLILYVKYIGGVLMEMEILNKILNKLNNIESDMSELKSDVSTLKQSNSRMEDEIVSLKESQYVMQEKIDKNTMILENIDETVSNVSESIEILKSETGKHDIDIKILSHKLNKKHNG